MLGWGSAERRDNLADAKEDRLKKIDTGKQGANQ